MYTIKLLDPITDELVTKLKFDEYYAYSKGTKLLKSDTAKAKKIISSFNTKQESE